MSSAPFDNDPTALQAELSRLSEKILRSDDPDIRAALERRMQEIREQLESMPANPPVENVSRPKPEAGPQELKRELAQASRALLSEEDPQRRIALIQRVKELQAVLGIDVAKLAGREISEIAPTMDTPRPESKGRVDLADLQAIVAEKSAQIHQQQAEEEGLDLPANSDPPTPEQAAEADRLVQQARVEKMRGNKAASRELLEKAVQTAPNSPTVLELVGDDFAERKQVGRALGYYRRAASIDPENVNLERKVAMAALGVSPGGAAESHLSTELGTSISDSPIPMASRNAAMLISLFLPGLGHIVLGKTTKGWITLAIWCALLAWVILMGGDVAKLGAMVVGGRSQPNLTVLIPILMMAVVYFATLADFKGPKEISRKPVERPRPPVDLPFE